MRRVVVVVGCLFAAFTAAPASSAPSVPCGPALAHTLAVSSGARVYSQSESVYGCAPAGRTIRLGSAILCLGGGRAGPAAAAGAVAAYALERCFVDTGSATVIVRRFADGRVLFDQPASTLSAGVESYTAVGSIVVNRTGQVAWISSEHSIVSQRGGIEVAERVGSGVRMLDSGPRIVTDSLRLNGATLTWRDGTTTRSATLS